MLVSNEIINEMYESAGDKRYQKAKAYVDQGRITITKSIYENKNNFELYGNVIGSADVYKTYIRIREGEIDDLQCDCPDYEKHYGTCKHILATLLEFVNKPVYEKIYSNRNHEEERIFYEEKIEPHENYRSFKQLINTFYNEEMSKLKEPQEPQIAINKNVKIIPKIIYDKFNTEIKVEFKIGITQMYKIRNLTEFYNRMLNKENFKYGAKLEFIHEEKAFAEESLPLLHFVLKYAEIIKYVNTSTNTGYRYYGKSLSDNCIILSNTGLDEIFEILKGTKVEFQKDFVEEKITFIPASPNINFQLEQLNKTEYIITPNIEVFEYNTLEGKEYSYILIDNFLYRCTKQYKETTLKMLEIFRKNYTSEIKFNEKDLPEFFSLVMPKIKENIKIGNIENAVIEKYIPKELGVKVFLDFDENDYVIAETKFCYGDVEFNPLDTEENVQIARNVVKEMTALNIFRKTGFMVDNKRKCFILVNDDSIYNFLSNDINEYMQNFEVLVTDNFKTKEIRGPKLGTIRSKSGK